MDVASAGAMKPGKGALTPTASGFLRWNAMVRPRHAFDVWWLTPRSASRDARFEPRFGHAPEIGSLEAVEKGRPARTSAKLHRPIDRIVVQPPSASARAAGLSDWL